MSDEQIADYLCIAEDIHIGMGEAFRAQDRHFRDHHEPVEGCWYCEHSDGDVSR